MRKLVATGALLLLTGCGSPVTESDIYGLYYLDHPSGRVELDVNKDHSFVESFAAKDGHHYSVHGTWFLTGHLTSDGSAIVNVNKFGAVNQSGGVGLGGDDSGLNVERSFGTTELCSYSLSMERDMCFRRAKTGK